MRDDNSPDPLLYGISVDGDGGCNSVQTEWLQEYSGGERFVWLHFCSRHPDTREALQSIELLDGLVIDALLAEDSWPRALVRDGALLLDLRAMNLWEGEAPEDMISLRLWTNGKLIVSARTRDIKSVDEMQEMIRDGSSPDSVGEFLTQIITKVFARMEPCIDEMEDEIGRFEEAIAEGQADEVGDSFGSVRKTNAILQRYIMPQERSLNRLSSADLPWLDRSQAERIAESHDRVIRYVETLRDLRDRLKIINEELERANDATLAKTSYMFAMAATIFLPLSFITGLLGVNVGGVPGTEEGKAFWILSGICLAVMAIQLIMFRKMRWF